MDEKEKWFIEDSAKVSDSESGSNRWGDENFLKQSSPMSEKEVLRKRNSANGKLGGIKRHESMRMLKEWAIEKYKAKKWPSANKAAHELKPEILAKAVQFDIKLSSENAQRTITEWFRESKKSTSSG